MSSFWMMSLLLMLLLYFCYAPMSSFMTFSHDASVVIVSCSDVFNDDADDDDDDEEEEEEDEDGDDDRWDIVGGLSGACWRQF